MPEWLCRQLPYSNICLNPFTSQKAMNINVQACLVKEGKLVGISDRHADSLKVTSSHSEAKVQKRRGYHLKFSLFRHLSIYLYIWLISLLERSRQGKVIRAQGDFTILSHSASCFFVGKNTEEELSRPLTLFLFGCLLWAARHTLVVFLQPLPQGST